MKIYIFGAGGFGREIAALAQKCGHSVAGFVDDSPHETGERLNGLPVIRSSDLLDTLTTESVVVAIGEPATRRTVVERLGGLGVPFATLIHPNVDNGDTNTIGDGSMICSGCAITVNISIGKHVILNLNTTIGHDCILEDYVSIMPGVNVSGCVRICEGAYIGTGAVIRNGTPDKFITIGAGAVVGMGAVVTKDISAGATVVGNPAKMMA